MKTILHFIKSYKKLIFFTILFMIFDVIGALYIPKITADMINNGVNNGNMQYVIQKGITINDISKIIAKKRNLKRMSSQAVGGAVGWNPVCIIIPY